MPDMSSIALRQRSIDYLKQIKGIVDVEPTSDDVISGGGVIVTNRLTMDGGEGWGWYYEQGEIKKALFNGEEIARAIASAVAPKTLSERFSLIPMMEFIKLCVISMLTIVLLVAVVWIVAVNPTNASLQALTGLLGLTVGWFIGKADKPAT